MHKDPTADLLFSGKLADWRKLPTPHAQGFTQEKTLIHSVVHSFIPNPLRFCQCQVGGFTREHRRISQQLIKSKCLL